MKKVLLLSIAIFAISYLSAQTVYCDFEGSPSVTGIGLVGGSGNATIEQVANPSPDALNGSATVLKSFVPSTSGTPAGAKLDSYVFTTGQSHDVSNYNALKVKIYVEGGTPALLKPRGRFGTWVDDATSPASGTWIGIVKDLTAEDGVPQGLTGWQQLYFDLSTKALSGNAIQIQMDWQDPRDYDLTIYFDDFEFVADIPTDIGNAVINDLKIYNDKNIIRVQGESTVDKIEILDITGRLAKQKIGIDIQEVNVSGLARGIYIVRAISGTKINTEKVLVK